MDPFPFERGEETLNHRVIVTISRSTHAACDSLIHEHLLEVGTGVLTASIGVVNQTRSGCASSKSHRR